MTTHKTCSPIVRLLISIIFVTVLLSAVPALAQLGFSNHQAFDQDTPGFIGAIEEFDHLGDKLSAGDFNGDGVTDLAIGTSREDIGSVTNAGAVYVLYGQPGNVGLTTTNMQLFSQNTPGFIDAVEEDDHLGSELSAGDFNGDGVTDLAIGTSRENIGSVTNAGAVYVLYGQPGNVGLTTTNMQSFDQDTPGFIGAVEEGDRLGDELSAGDFNGDGITDLAIGAGLEDIGSVIDAGAVYVLYGQPGNIGLTTTNMQLFSQNTPGFIDAVEESDRLGTALSAGDFNGDGVTDLAIGTSREDIGSVTNAGAVYVLYGQPGNVGLATTNMQLFNQNTPGFIGAVEESDRLGNELSAGDFNGDGIADLAIATSREDIGSVADAGAVYVLYGQPGNVGLTTTNMQLFNQNTLGFIGAAEENDRLGTALSAGDFNGDGITDLAIGAGFEDIGSVTDAGAVYVLYGQPGNVGLTTTNMQSFDQDTQSFIDAVEEDDLLGTALSAGDFNGDGITDLAIGAGFEDIGSVTNAGAVYTLYGTGIENLIFKDTFDSN